MVCLALKLEYVCWHQNCMPLCGILHCGDYGCGGATAQNFRGRYMRLLSGLVTGLLMFGVVEVAVNSDSMPHL